MQERQRAQAFRLCSTWMWPTLSALSLQHVTISCQARATCDSPRLVAAACDQMPSQLDLFVVCNGSHNDPIVPTPQHCTFLICTVTPFMLCVAALNSYDIRVCRLQRATCTVAFACMCTGRCSAELAWPHGSVPGCMSLCSCNAPGALTSLTWDTQASKLSCKLFLANPDRPAMARQTRVCCGPTEQATDRNSTVRA